LRGVERLGHAFSHAAGGFNLLAAVTAYAGGNADAWPVFSVWEMLSLLQGVKACRSVHHTKQAGRAARTGELQSL
jgi:hypothetical protein